VCADAWLQNGQRLSINYVRFCWSGGSLFLKGDASSSGIFQRFYRFKAMGFDHSFGG